MNKKYLPSALILYLNYFIHGVGCSILGQAVIKEALATAWGVEAMAITAISAALGLGRLIALPFAGPLSDKLGRRISTAIGSASYAIYLIGLALAFNAGTHGGYTIAYVCAIIGGIANSFLDTGIYPAVSEIIYKAPGVATMGIKFFIAIAQMLLPFVLGVAVTSTAAGLTSYNPLFYGCGIAYIVLFVLVFLFPLPDADQKASGKKEGLIDSLKHTHFSFESIAMILTLIGLEFLTIIFKNVGEHSSLLVFATTDKENLKRVTNELHLRNYRIASYDMQHEPLEHADLYHVTMVIKTKRYLDESELFQFMQSLPDLTLERIA